MVTVSSATTAPHSWFTAGISDRSAEKIHYITCGINAPRNSFEEFITFYAQKLSEAAE